MHLGRDHVYGWGVSSQRTSALIALVVYTVLRVALFFGVWALLWFLTPLDALWSAVAAILVSGAISLIVLDRQRGRVGAAAGGFFSRIIARIDAATRAEDVDEPWEGSASSGAPAAGGLSGQREQDAEDDSVGEKK